MSLPPALAARLAKRGIIGEEYLAANEKKTRIDIEEEVIAENYDANFNSKSDGEELSSQQAARQLKGHSGCPNKWNIFHECTAWCVRQWGKGHTNPDPKYLRKQARALSKYPLPDGWRQVWDAGTGRHYYWDVTSDLVSWLPPGHPRATVTEPAAILREERVTLAVSPDNSGDSDSDAEEGPDPRPRLESREVPKDKRRRPDPRRKADRNDLDPMDPASYSNIPRGKWSDGLDTGGNEAKTGADVTANGPLFQMRPYPSPGAVLRANAANASKQPPP